jgi:hypothetical protein
VPQLVKTGVSFVRLFTNRCHDRDVRVTQKVKRGAVRTIGSAKFRTGAPGRP